MRIGIDVDDVLGDFFNSFRSYYLKTNKQDLPDNIFDEDAFKGDPEKNGIIGDILDFLHSPELLKWKRCLAQQRR